MKKPLRFLALVAMLCIPWVTQAQETLTVHNGTTNSSVVPFDGYNADAAQHNQMIYPASELTDMDGMVITQMVFYIDPSANNGSNTAASRLGTWTVSLGETDATTLSGLDNTTELTQVYQGYFDCSTGTLTLLFDNDYAYHGGNLLVDINHAAASWNKWYFLGETVPGASYTYGSQRDFLPKTTFTYGAPATCPKPTNLHLESVTAYNALVSWTPGGSESAWDLYWTTSNVPPTAETPYNVGGTTLNTNCSANGLEPFTHYYLYVRARCTDEDRSAWTSALEFTTGAAVPMNETFSTSSLPDGWTKSNTLLDDDVMSGTTEITLNNNNGWSFGTSNGVFDSHAKVNVYGSSCKYWLIAPTLMMEDNVQLTFDLALTAYSGSTPTAPATTGTDDKFVVLISDGSRWDVLRQWDNAGSADVYNNIAITGEEVAIDLSSYAGQDVTIAFYVESTASNADNNLHIDNVRIDYIPSCFKPTGLTLEGVTTNSAEVSWTAGGSETAWDVYWTTSDEPPTAGTTPSLGNTSLNDHFGAYSLTPSSHYYLYVRARCSDADRSEWTAALQFDTECEAIDAVGFSQNFDALTVPSESNPSSRILPTCWSFINTCTYSSYKFYPSAYYYSYTDYSHSTQNSLSFYSYYSGYSDYDPQDQYAILPEMNDLSGKQVSLWARGYNATSTFFIGTMSDPTDANTFHAIGGERALTTSYQEFELIVPTTTDSYLAIMIEAANSSRATNRVFIDDIVISEPPSCIRPSDLQVVAGDGNLTAHTVTLEWTANNSETDWVLAYKKSTEENFTEVPVDENPYTLTGLDGSTTYNIKVKADCGAGSFSEWTNPINVTTLMACPAPTSLTKSPFVSTALLGWTSDASQFVVAYKANGEDDFTEISDITENPYTLTGLAATTTYTFKVKAVCGGIDGESQWSSTSSFTTVDACAAVSGLAVSGITETGATLTWNAGEATDWVLQYGTDNTFASFEEENPTTATWTFTGLTSNTVYYARVKVAGCDDENEHWSTVSFEPTNKVVVGSGNATSSYLPSNTNYNYSYTQQIYTAAELGAAGAIMSVDFYMTSNTDYTRNLDVYMVQTIKTDFASSNDWVDVTASDLVFSGQVTFNGNSWTTINLDSPFIYDGTNNVVVVVDDNTGTYSSKYFKTFTVTGNQSHYAYQDGSNIDPAAPSASTNSITTSKNQARFLIGEPPTCNKPTNLVFGVGGQSVNITWDSDASEWDVAYATSSTADPEENIDATVTTASYSVDNLPVNADYYFWVRSNCGSDGYSDWTAPYSVHIGYCVPEATSVDGSGISNVTFGMGENVVNNDNHPSSAPYYGDYHTLIGAVQAGVEATIDITYATGYNYGTIIWVDLDNDLTFEDEEILYTGTSESANPTTLNATITIPGGQATGDYRMRIGGADSYFDTYISSGSGSHDPCAGGSYRIFEDYTLRVLAAPSCVTPTALTVDVSDDEAELSWTDNGETDWVVAYMAEGDADFTEEAVTTNPYTLTGLSLATNYTVKVKADCGTDGTSEWSTPVNFTTAPCLAADMCEITFTLTDEYGDGWNGAYIEVIDVATSNTIAMIEADDHGTYQEETDIKTLSVCDGSQLQFVWHSGSYDDEVTYNVTDANGDPIFDGVGAMLSDEYYTVDCGGGSSSVVSIDKSITANQWYAISSPVHEDGKNYEVVLNITNLISGTYDLMRWDETQAVWESQKSSFSTLDMGRGYIYRNAANQELTFNDYSYSGSIGVDITHTCIDYVLAGFNLIGNPYTKAYTPDHDYYKLQTNGTWTAYTAGNGSVAVAEGFLIFEDGTDIYMFQEPAKGVKSVDATTLAFTVSNDEYSDVAYARFGAGEGMPKFGHLNPAAPMLSIPQGETSYAIANLDESTESFPLSFSGNGEYTLSVDNTAAFGYLHLIDRATGADIDLLRASYTFESTGSNADRFLVKLSPDNNENTFVRINGDRIIVDGTGELEVYDVMGRQLNRATVDGTTSLDSRSLGLSHTGVYVLRLNGNSQKIVIK